MKINHTKTKTNTKKKQKKTKTLIKNLKKIEPGAEDDEVFVNPEWVHIEPILDFFLQLIVNE
jgi:hypothetical protein